MVIDTSAVLAILQNEPERRAFNELIEKAPTRSMSVPSWVEASMVLQSRFGAEGMRDLDRLVETARIEIVPVDQEQGEEAREAFRRFGKGRHAAGLNFGDCFSYGLAKSLGQPLLFKGNDFTETDIQAATKDGLS